VNDVTTEATRSFFAAFKDSPLLLASVLTNAALLGFLYYQGSIAASERHSEMAMLYQNREFVGKLLAECQPVPREK
jgi:hypothetical protein